MRGRFGMGPVFTYEWLITSRRWQVYAARSLFVALLLAGLAAVWWTEVADQRLTTLQDLAGVGESFYNAIVGIQLALVLAVAPAAMAGSICVDKARGTLAHVLVTDLSDAEIVLGKLAARLISVLGGLTCTLPVLALGSLLGGIDPLALAGAFLVAIGLALFGSTLAMTLSVWARRPYEVLFATYAVLSIWLLARPTSAFVFNAGWSNWAEVLDPIGLTFEPGAGSRGRIAAPAWFLLLSGLASVGLTAIAVRRIRSVASRQAGCPGATRRAFRLVSRLRAASQRLPGPSLDGNPVLWREWHRNRPSTWLLALWMLYATIAGLFTLGTILVVATGGGSNGMAPWVNGLQTSIGFLLLAVVGSTSLAEERAQGRLDVLLATPLPSRAIVLGKWWGAYRLVPWLALAPGLIVSATLLRDPDFARGIGLGLIVGLILAYGAALTSLGLALATWITRPSRVLVAAVSAHLLITVGWFFGAVTLIGDQDLGQGVALASSFFGPGMLTALMTEDLPRSGWYACAGWAATWIFVYAVIATVLFQSTVARFDRSMGRASGAPDRLPPDAKTTVKNEHVSTLSEWPSN